MSMDDWKSEPIAVVGSSCRLPGGTTSPSKLWTLLQSPRDVRSDISTAKRFNTRGFYHEHGDHHGVSEAGHLPSDSFLNKISHVKQSLMLVER